MTETLKVVWLCQFINSDFIQKFGKHRNYREVAPWINNLIRLFENKRDIELHIVAPNFFNRKEICFKENEIIYHLYPPRKLLPARIWRIFKIPEITNFITIKLKVKKIIYKINPNIIHLYGGENPYYSSAVIPFLKNSNKVLITIQGFISLDNENTNNLHMRKRKKIEKTILKEAKNFGVRIKDSCNVIKQFNDNPVFYWHDLPLTKPGINLQENAPSKEYDCVIFGRVSPENGHEDLLKAVSLVKKTKNDISMVIVGPFKDDEYKNKLMDICEQLNITENVFFKGYIKSQQDAFKEVIKAKVDVLLTYYDVIPGTILECMYLGVPVISYAVGGIPELNDERESLVLVNKGDVAAVAEKIIQLLADEVYRGKLSANAKITVGKFYDDEKIYNDIIYIYQELNEK
jgi:glycosyltransferase involved in cell wall biosynthesis